MCVVVHVICVRYRCVSFLSEGRAALPTDLRLIHKSSQIKLYNQYSNNVLYKVIMSK